MTDKNSRTETNSPAEPDANSGVSASAWYRSSYLFVLVSISFLSRGDFLVGLLLLTVALFNHRREDWYRHRWPWLILVPLIAICISNLLAFWLAAANPDPLVSYELPYAR